MERSDYQRFINVWIANNLNQQGKYYLQCKEIDEKTPLPYAKLRLTGTRFVEKETIDSSLHQGIFIDIFPFDNLKKNVSLLFRFKYILFRYLMVVCEYKNGYRGFKTKGKEILARLCSFLPYSHINRFQYKFMTHFNKNVCQDITSMASGYGFRRHCCSRRNLCGRNTIKFINDYFECPSNPDEYLRHLFGDNYMEIPPLEKRNTHHSVVKIDFGSI